MTLTLSNGPLSRQAPDTTNYVIDGPKNKILFSPFPRRVRGVYAGETLVDTDAGMLLHESGIPAVLYAPVDDVRVDLLTKTDHSTHCPYKGDASYWTITVGQRISENSVWGYEDPMDSAPWLDGYVAFYWNHLDHWYDEDEEVFGHLRDPYHRIDVRSTSRHVRVTIAGEVVAETTQAQILSETGIPNRYYIPLADIQDGRFEKSETTTHCPYKGDTEYWTLIGDQPVTDVAWSYPTTFDEARGVAAHWSFDGEDVSIEVR